MVRQDFVRGGQAAGNCLGYPCARTGAYIDKQLPSHGELSVAVGVGLGNWHDLSISETGTLRLKKGSSHEN